MGWPGQPEPPSRVRRLVVLNHSVSFRRADERGGPSGASQSSVVLRLCSRLGCSGRGTVDDSPNSGKADERETSVMLALKEQSSVRHERPTRSTGPLEARPAPAAVRRGRRVRRRAPQVAARIDDAIAAVAETSNRPSVAAPAGFAHSPRLPAPVPALISRPSWAGRAPSSKEGTEQWPEHRQDRTEHADQRRQGRGHLRLQPRRARSSASSTTS